MELIMNTRREIVQKITPECQKAKKKVKKHGDTPKTPFLSVIDSPSVGKTIKQSLHHQYDEL